MPQIIPAAVRALQVFEVYAREHRPLTNSELARLLDLADSSCSDLLYTLRQSGYLLRTPKSRLFHPTARLLDIAQGIATSDPLHIFATEAMEILTRESGETAMCGLLDGEKVKIFACQESPRALRYVLRPGSTVDVHSTALGKALLGAMTSKEREEMLAHLALAAITEDTITDPVRLREEIERSAETQCYAAFNEGSEGVGALAVSGPVGGRLVALSIVGPMHRMRKNREAYTQMLREARKEIFTA